MTMQELYSLRHLKREIELYEAKLQELRSAAQSITANYTGMPHGTGISDKVGNGAAAIADYTNLLEKAKQRLIAEELYITKYILSVNDAQVREIMHLRFVLCKSWIETAMRIGGNNTADGVRMRVKRYIEQN